MFVINDGVNSETGVWPLDAMFGSADGPYFRLPDSVNPSSITSTWVRGLDEDLRHIGAKSSSFQQELVKERTLDTPEECNRRPRTVISLGILCRFNGISTVPRPTKLTSPCTGPFEVIQPKKNDDECRHLVMGGIRVLHVTRLKLIVGTQEEAYKAALLDADQFVIARIHYWRGNPEKRSQMFVYAEFDDGDKVLLPYSKDLSAAALFEAFVYSKPQLFLLRFNAADAPTRVTSMRKKPIRNVDIHDVFYLDLRYWGYDWFDALDLPKARMSLPMLCNASMWLG